MYVGGHDLQHKYNTHSDEHCIYACATPVEQSYCSLVEWMFQLGGWIDIRPVGGDPSRTPYSVFALLHYPHRTSLSLSLSLSHFVEFATPQYSLLLLLHFSTEGEGFREGSFRPCISVCMRMGVYEDHSKGGEVIKQFKRISDLILIV